MRVTGLGTRADTYYPTLPMSGSTPRWQSMDSADADMGSINPVYMEVPGATPSKIVAQLSKDGHLYLLDAAALGGVDGHKVDFTVAGNGMSIHTAPGAYRTAMGSYFVFSTTANASGCPGGVSGRAVMAVRIGAGAIRPCRRWPGARRWRA